MIRKSGKRGEMRKKIKCVLIHLLWLAVKQLVFTLQHHWRLPCSSDLGRAAVRLVWRPSALLLLPQGDLHPSVRHVRVPCQRSHPVPPSLALSLLPPHGRHQRVLRICADDSGCWQSAARAERAGRWVVADGWLVGFDWCFLSFTLHVEPWNVVYAMYLIRKQSICWFQLLKCEDVLLYISADWISVRFYLVLLKRWCQFWWNWCCFM